MCRSPAQVAWDARPGRSSNWISRCRRLAIYLRDEFACSYCGRDLHDADPREITLDHLVPRERWKCRIPMLYRGKTILVIRGLHDPTNLVTACRSCNSGRKHRLWYKYATLGAIGRIRRLRYRKPNIKLARAIIRGEAPIPGKIV